MWPKPSNTEPWIVPSHFDPPALSGRRPALVVALTGLYLIWGSTYLAIRFAIATIPPFFMAGGRFLVAGAVLYAWARVRGSERPTMGLWRTGAISGILLLLGGNGAVVWAEQFVPSGLVALLVATVPLWIVLQDWVSGKGSPPSPGVVFGILWGFGGVALLVTGSEIGQAGPEDLLGGLLVLGGAGCWAAGSLVARYGVRPASAAMGNGMQMLAGGGAFFLRDSSRAKGPGWTSGRSPGDRSWPCSTWWASDRWWPSPPTSGC